MKQGIRKMTTELSIDYHDTIIGTIITIFDQGLLCALDFKDYEERCTGLLRKSYPDHRLVRTQDPYGMRARIDRYLEQDYAAFDDIEIALSGTVFQKQVWLALRTIPAGTTIGYGALAQQIGRPKAVRALGHANSLNPIALVLPCHRVIGKDGSLTGYAGGLGRKEWLLRHEGISQLALFAPKSRPEQHKQPCF